MALSELLEELRLIQETVCSLEPEAESEMSAAAIAECLARLGLEATATWDVARKVYKKLALRHHPDRPGGNSDRFIAISTAYHRLEAHFGKAAH